MSCGGSPKRLNAVKNSQRKDVMTAFVAVAAATPAAHVRVGRLADLSPFSWDYPESMGNAVCRGDVRLLAHAVCTAGQDASGGCDSSRNGRYGLAAPGNGDLGLRGDTRFIPVPPPAP